MTPQPQQPPVSWVLLERYALGELAPAEATAVAARIESCPETRRCLEMILEDRRQLPPLPVVAGGSQGWWSPRSERWRLAERWRLGAGLAAAAVAAAILLLLFRSDRPAPRVAALEPPGPRLGIKGGGEILLGLVRNRAGATNDQPTSFRPGDAFKLVVTCAPDRELDGEVLVYQGGEVFLPLPRFTLQCHNRAVVPGAFTLTGDTSATICISLALDDAPLPDTEELVRSRPEALPGGACLKLESTD